MDLSDIDDLEAGDEAGIELTPLIDVIFMLLIFFIVATTFVKPKFEVALPDVDSAKTVEENEKKQICAVTIDAAGTVFFDGEETPPSAFPQKFAEHGGKIFEVFSDKCAPFGAVMTLMDEAKKQGNESLLFMVEKEH